MAGLSDHREAGVWISTSSSELVPELMESKNPPGSHSLCCAAPKPSLEPNWGDWGLCVPATGRCWDAGAAAAPSQPGRAGDGVEALTAQVLRLGE